MQEDMDCFGDIASLDDNVEQFLPHDGGDGSNLYGTLKQSSTEHQKESTKGIPLWHHSILPVQSWNGCYSST